MASGAFGLSPQAQIFLIGSGILYLIYASKKGLFPFNKGGPASTVTDLFSSSSGDNSGDSSGDFMSPPPRGFDARKNIDLGNGFQMPIPPGGTSSGNGYLPGQKGPTQPFVSTVANDPTPTDYGIYTQYLNGLRNEYQKMDERQRLAGTQQIGIGGDITTLPQPPGVGGIPYGTNGVRPPYMGPYMGPLPFRPPPPMRRMPPPYYQQRRYYGSGGTPPGLLYSPNDDSGNNGFSIDAPGVHIGMDGINVGVPSQYDLNRLENLGSSSGTNNNFQQMVQDKINSQIHNLSNSDLGPSSMDNSFSGDNSNSSGSGSDTSSDGSGGGSGGSDTSSMDSSGGDSSGDNSSGGDSGGGSSGGSGHHHSSSKHHKKKHHSKKKHHHHHRSSRFATFVNYDEGPAPVPVDLNRINPTLFNMVSRNQPGGMIGYKLGNY